MADFMIEIKSKETSIAFVKSNDIVFRILTYSGDNLIHQGMLITKQETDKKISEANQTPSFINSPLIKKIAMLYIPIKTGDMPTEKHKYSFMFRKIGTKEWKEWFIVQTR